MKRIGTCRLLGRIISVIVLTSMATTTLAQDEWEYTLSPLFLWGVNINGDATIGDATAPLDLDFKDDILENLDAVFTLHFEARKDKWTVFAEVQHMRIKPTVEMEMGSIFVEADIDFESNMLELGGAYAFSQTQNTRWELIGGARYTDQDVGVDVVLTFPPPINEQMIEIVGGDNWWHAFAGMRVFHTLSEKWTLIGRADLGYGGSDNSAVNAAFMFDYRFNNWGSAFAGYRYLKYDYDNGSDNDGYGYDAYQQGPLLGLTIHW